MEISGKLFLVTVPMQGVSKAGKAWINQTIVVETAENYPKKIPIELQKQELIDKVNRMNVGDNITVSINLDGREYQGRWFTKVIGWKI